MGLNRVDKLNRSGDCFGHNAVICAITPSAIKRMVRKSASKMIFRDCNLTDPYRRIHRRFWVGAEGLAPLGQVFKIEKNQCFYLN